MSTSQEICDWETRLTLLGRARDPADETAWQEFAAYYRGFIRVVLTKMNVNANDLDDLQQEILLRLWKILGRYDEERAAFRTWLGRIIQGKVTDHYRKTGRLAKQQIALQEQPGETEALPDLEAIIEAEWKQHLVKLALTRVSEHFSPRAMTAFTMSMKGRSSAEIAAELNIKPNSANKLKNRVKLRVVQEIEYLREELES